MKRAYKLLESMPPPVILGIGIFVGSLLILGSIAAHVHAITWTPAAGPTKQLGYLYEINWSINYLIVIPVAWYFVVLTVNSIQESISLVTDAKMILDEHGIAVTYDDVLNQWHDAAAIGMWFAVVCYGFSFLASYVEWAIRCLLPLLRNTPLQNNAPGWVVAALIEPGKVSRAANILFGFIAYTAQAVAAGTFLAFITLNITFASWVFRFTTKATKQELYPSVKSEDTRCGFERFEQFVENVLSATLAFFAMLFTMRLNSLYTDPECNATSLTAFIAHDIGVGFFTETSKLFQDTSSSKLFDIVVNSDYTSAMASFAVLVMVPVAFLIPSVILRQSAMRARDRFRVLLSADGASTHPACHGLTNVECQQKIKVMTVWPILYPKPVQLLLGAALAMGAFFFYRLTLLVAGFAIASGLRQLFKVLAASDQDST